MLFRIVTERKDKPEITVIVSRYFRGFTLIDGDGYWESNPEPSLIIEVETEELGDVVDAAIAIKRRNGQQKVMIQRIPNDAWLV